MIERYKKELIDAKKRSISQEIKEVSSAPAEKKEKSEVVAVAAVPREESEEAKLERAEEKLQVEEKTEPSKEEPVISPAMSEEETIEDETDGNEDKKTLGSLRVQVFMANRAYPVPSAHVVITGTKNKRVYFDGYTDTNGVVGRLLLPAPKKIYSQSPQETPPYSQYDIMVSHPKFQSRKYIGVPVFGGVESIQNIQLLPLGSDETDSMTVTESEPNELLKKGGVNNA